eukprot:600556-Rhodomonas_salina.2
MPAVGAQILAKIPEEDKDTPFFAEYPADYYPVLRALFRLFCTRSVVLTYGPMWYQAEVQGVDEEEGKLAVQFADGGPFVGYEPGIPATVGEDFVPLPEFGSDLGCGAHVQEGDKVTLSQEYWDECCSESWDPSVRS